MRGQRRIIHYTTTFCTALGSRRFGDVSLCTVWLFLYWDHCCVLRLLVEDLRVSEVHFYLYCRSMMVFHHTGNNLSLCII